MRTTDMADELFRGPETELPAGVRLATAKRGGVTVTRVEIAREGLARPRGRYVTLEMPSVSVLDERDTDVIETGAAELRALLPPEGPVLVLGIGNRRVTADALGPRTAQKILVTMGPQHTLPVRGIRPVAALAPGVSGDTGLTLRQLAAAIGLVRQNAAQWHVLPDKIAVCGFSAGGHLALSGAVLDCPGEAADRSRKPDAVLLAYPVITAGEYAHRGSFVQLSGSEDRAEHQRFGLEEKITPDTPPVFVWHTGVHGTSISTAEVDAASVHRAHWVQLAVEWLNDTFDFHLE